MMEKIKLIWFWVKNNKYKLLFLLLIIICLLYTTSSKKVNETLKQNTPKPSPLSNTNYEYDRNNIPKYKNKAEVYLINKFETPNFVKNFAWDKNKVIYSSSNGIYKLGDNKRILNENNIKESFFDTRGSLSLVLQDNGSTLYNLNNGSKKKIDILPTKKSIKTNDNLNYILYVNSKDSLLHLFDLNTNLDKPVSNVSNISYEWIFKQNKFYIYNDKSGKVEVFDTDLQKQKEIDMSNEKLISISPDINYIITVDSNKLYIKDFNKNIIFSNSFKNTSELSVFWINNENFIVVEKVKLEYLDLYDQYLWLVDIKGKIKYLTNSEPIIGKINTNIAPKVNDDLSAFIIVDNNGYLWIFSLKESVMPTYNDDGVYFYKMPNITKEDSL